MPLFECQTRSCYGNLIFQLRPSKFSKLQEAKLEELAENVPKGQIPRTMTVHFKGELTRKVSPGDAVELSGIFLPLPVPDTGSKTMRAGLASGTYLEAMSVSPYVLRGYAKEQMDRLRQDGDAYNKLSRSIAPGVFVHEDIKKLLLLLLVGAPHRELNDGTKMRGNLHVCLIGDDHGDAKTQLLKHIISTVSPMGLYTTGKGSKGALSIANMGICAIDELEEMDDTDCDAVREAMEHSSKSLREEFRNISQKKLTVLAAANPAGERYHTRKTPAENMNLPRELLSRFDILWLISDADLELNKESPAILEPSVLRTYISEARAISPSIPRELQEYIATAYVGIRQDEAESNVPHCYTNIRTLLSIYKMSLALARLRFSVTVAQSDVDEALRLMQMSKLSLYSDERRKSGLDAISDIYSILRAEAARTGKMDISYAHALNWISGKGYSEAKLKECMKNMQL